MIAFGEDEKGVFEGFLFLIFFFIYLIRLARFEVGEVDKIG